MRISFKVKKTITLYLKNNNNGLINSTKSNRIKDYNIFLVKPDNYSVNYRNVNIACINIHVF